MTLLELAERCEKAEGGEQREMLVAAFKALPRAEEYYWQRADWFRFQRMLDAEAYESAALSLVPEGHEHNWSLIGSDTLGGPSDSRWQAEVVDELADAATPALALCAAALRARAAAGLGEGDEG